MTSLAEPAPAPAPHIIILVLCAAVSPLAINIFIPSMPGMAKEFGVPYATIQLGLSLYLAMTAAITLVAGPLSDLFGRRPMIIGGFLLFVLGSAMTLLADNATVFLAGRIIQAASATGMVLSRAIVRDLYDRDMAASMIGYVTMGMAVAPMVGPAIGGLLDDLYGWRASFLFLAVLGTLATLVVMARLPETNSTRGQPLSRQFESYGSLLSSEPYWYFAGSGALAACIFYGFLGGGPVIASHHLAMTPTSYGLWFAATAVGYMIGNFISGRHSRRIGVARMLLFGALISLVGALLPFALLGWLDLRLPVALFGPTILIGIGNGMTIPNATAAAVSVRPEAAGAASGLMGAIQVGFGALASVLAGIMAGDGSGIWGFSATLAAFALIAFFLAWRAWHLARHPA
ncbi:Bcr/CflA family drug resistance efflux transporter [Zhengella mangrovi]|uniref:Bcr/CflA family efflux transporter n=1 Tax=Zhengella mangrovi TaxID=1982044 RepID=A0A2G1QHI1_9HYPH|nr:multidrug effflux MFS transporter [Zhengella mangrovi]PHP64920.1 Bcr/CflA family drug resistance efflux transporter [Zhengella mangrovi]